MQIYFPSLGAIQQQTLQLEDEQCNHCHQTQSLVSHGFVYRKRAGAEPIKIGKRVFCSNRHRRTGCGHTIQLYLASTLCHLHYAAGVMEAFLLALLAGIAIGRAYQQATKAAGARNAYRWLHKLTAQLSTYRSLLHQPLPADDRPQTSTPHPQRRGLLATTLATLVQQFGEQLCAGYQLKQQGSFL